MGRGERGRVDRTIATALHRVDANAAAASGCTAFGRDRLTRHELPVDAGARDAAVGRALPLQPRFAGPSSSSGSRAQRWRALLRVAMRGLWAQDFAKRPLSATTLISSVHCQSLICRAWKSCAGEHCRACTFLAKVRSDFSLCEFPCLAPMAGAYELHQPPSVC